MTIHTHLISFLDTNAKHWVARLSNTQGNSLILADTGWIVDEGSEYVSS